MPIVDVELVHRDPTPDVVGLATSLADALGKAFGAAPGTLWVRVYTLCAERYAENESPLGDDELPVFVSVLLSRPPVGPALEAQVRVVGIAVAAATGRPPERVHVEYAPGGAGRIAFGGQLVR